MNILDFRFSILDAGCAPPAFQGRHDGRAPLAPPPAASGGSIQESRIEPSGARQTAAGSPQGEAPRSQHRKSPRAFSLVEVLAAVALIGIITFLALPNIVQVKQDSEQSLAVARAEALNLALASHVRAQGFTSAASAWAGASNAEARYQGFLAPYLAFAPEDFSDYMPAGYTVTLPATIATPLTKIPLSGPDGTITY